MSSEFLVSDLYFNPNVCHICKCTFKSVKKCSGCKSISYCSKEHQKFHWSSHKPLCISLQGIRKELGNDVYQVFKSSKESDIERKCSVKSKNIKPSEQILLGEQGNSSQVDKTTKIKLNQSLGKNELEAQVSMLSLSQQNNCIADNDVKKESNKNDQEQGETLNPISSSGTQNKLFIEAYSLQINKSNEKIMNLMDKEWIQSKFKLLTLVENLLGRNLRNIEKEIVLNPKCCIVCKDSNSELVTCETCFSVNYCNEHVHVETHNGYCKQLFLLYKINKYIVDKYLTNSFAYIEKISNYLEPHLFENELEKYELSEYTSFYRTLVYLIKFLNFSKTSLTLHVVGASEYECSPYSIYLWENIFHQISFIDNITISFVGFDVTSDQFQMRLCENCIEKDKVITVQCHQMSYHSFIDLHNKKDKSQLGADLIIAFNAGFHEFENQSDSDTWTQTLDYILSTKTLPIAFTAYTKDEIHRDSQIIKKNAQAKDKVDVHFMIESDVNPEASDKPRVDPEGGVYYLNKYITSFYCK